MLVNSSVLDNEFFESDIPFELNASALRHPVVGFSSKKRLFAPRYFSDSCVRYMLTFLAQYGREWLRDSNELMREKEKRNGLLMGNFLHVAKLLSFRNNVCRGKKNWSHTWSRILMSREASRYYVDDESSEGLQMPFGFKSEKASETGDESSDAESSDDIPLRLFEVSFKRHESRIKRLIDSLPPGLFEKEEQDNVEMIQHICSLDFENFLLFLQINPVEPLDTVKSSKPTSLVADDDSGNKKVVENNCEVFTSHITSRFVPRYVPHMDDDPDGGPLPLRIAEDTVLNEKIGPCHGAPSWADCEFMLHLENLSAISHRSFTFGSARREKIDWKAYLEQFRMGPSLSRFFKTRTYKPQCLSQLYYWHEYSFPKCTPPGIGDKRMKKLFSFGRRVPEGIRFIGYIMEMVRTRLAKWTASAHENQLHRGRWTTEIPEEWSMEFRAKSDLSMLCHGFEKEKDVSYISIPKRWGGAWRNGDEFKWTCYEQVLWECQQHLLDLVSDDERESGPQNVELILLFLLGFPILSVWSDKIGIHLKPIVPGSELTVYAALTGNSPNDVHIQMEFHVIRELESRRQCKSHPTKSDNSSRSERGHEFCWEDWIHKFEGCMKFLSMDHLREERTVKEFGSDAYNDDEGCRGSEDTENNVGILTEIKPGEIERVADHDNNRNGTEVGGNGGCELNDKIREEKRTDMANSLKDDDSICVCASPVEKADEGEIGENGSTPLEDESKRDDQIMENGNGGDGSESNEHPLFSSESERGGDDGSDLGVGQAERKDDTTSVETTSSTSTGAYHVTRCACEYRLDQRAEKRIIKGTNEYYWHWEGWTPQRAFQEFRILYELEGSDNENAISAEEEDENDFESTSKATWGEEAEEAVWVSEEEGDEAENAFTLTDEEAVRAEEGDEAESALTLTDGEEMV
ncbi:hypothetical protein FGB62_10g14 [Gracilaria domingensis]|nr:hypothetical protein FGB62_10g14 [Gracilaria domingensis]